jgi:hypothetical protein
MYKLGLVLALSLPWLIISYPVITILLMALVGLQLKNNNKK